jgi:hypothetical protein
MWDFLGIIIDQLSETFRWFLSGFFITIVTLILLYKNNLLNKSGPLSFIKKVSYYLFFPLYIGIVCWFTSATLIVEKDAKELTRITLEKAESSLFPQFSYYILSLADGWIDRDVDSKEELVNNYLEINNYEKGSISTKAMEWTLTNGLEYIENKAIENGTLQIGDEKINFPKLISEYLSGVEGVAETPFNYLKNKSLNSIHSYTKSFYWIYFLMGFVVILILSLDVYFNLNNRRNKEDTNFVNPSTTLENNQKNIENTLKELDGKKKLE